MTAIITFKQYDSEAQDREIWNTNFGRCLKIASVYKCFLGAVASGRDSFSFMRVRFVVTRSGRGI